MDRFKAAQWDGEMMDRDAAYATGERPRVGDRVEAKGGSLMTVVGLYAEQGIALCRAEDGRVYRVPFSDLGKVAR